MDKFADHCFGHVVVGDNAVLQRAHCNDVLRGSAYHLVGLRTDRNDCFFLLIVSHHGRFIQHNALSGNGDDDIRGAKVYAYIKCHIYSPFSDLSFRLHWEIPT